MTPFLRWAGSKRKLLPFLRSPWTAEFHRYVEPFMGSACLFFDLLPRVALLADTNHQLVKTYEVVRDRPHEVYHQLRKWACCEETYYVLRDSAPVYKDALFDACRFIYLNRYCFNGIYRTNTAGKFNVPFGRRCGNLPTLLELLTASSALQNVRVQCSDFETTLRDVGKGDFVYLDPPYSVGNRRVFKQYGPAVFGTKDLERLAARLCEIDRSGAKFLLSYAECEEAVTYFGKWSMTRLVTTRNIAGFVRHRRTDVELTFSNIKMGDN